MTLQAVAIGAVIFLAFTAALGFTLAGFVAAWGLVTHGWNHVDRWTKVIGPLFMVVGFLLVSWVLGSSYLEHRL